LEDEGEALRSSSETHPSLLRSPRSSPTSSPVRSSHSRTCPLETDLASLSQSSTSSVRVAARSSPRSRCTRSCAQLPHLGLAQRAVPPGIKFGDYQVTITVSSCRSASCASPGRGCVFTLFLLEREGEGADWRSRPVQPVEQACSKDRPCRASSPLRRLEHPVPFAIHVVRSCTYDLCDQFSPYVFSSFYFAPADSSLIHFFHAISPVAAPTPSTSSASSLRPLEHHDLPHLPQSCAPAFLTAFRCTGPPNGTPLHHQNKSRPLRSTSKAVRSARASRRTRRCTTACSVSRPSRSRARPTLCQSSTGGCSWLRWTRL